MTNPELLPTIATVAASEGWTIQKHTKGVFAGLLMIGSLEAYGRFECDVDAEQFVRYQAANGSSIHQMALEAHKLPAADKAFQQYFAV